MIRLLIFLLFFSCSGGTDNGQAQENENTITIKGTVGHPQQGTIVLEKVVENQVEPYDTIELEDNNSFSHTVEVNKPGYYRLNFYGKQFVVLILENDDLEVNVDGNRRDGFVKVTGSKAHDLINDVQLAQQQFQQGQEVSRLNQEFSEARQAGDTERQEEIQQEYIALEEQLNQKLIKRIDSAGSTLAVVDLLSSGRILDKERYFEFYDRKAGELKAAMPDNERVQNFNEQVEKMRVTAIGQTAPEIALPNPEGEVVKLSSLRGNYVLVDFWAKWCRPCRLENPNIVRMYNRFNDQGFEVFGVSLDRNKEDWLQGIEEDNLHWTQVSDLKFWNSEAAQTYGINAIPFALLLDPEGKIIAKNLRGEELERKLEEIFSSK